MTQVSDEPRFTPQTRLLVIAPHPDDETLATGILIQRVRAAGGRVDILLLTDGDNNPWPQRLLERRIRVGAADRARWAERRRSEIMCALRHLGVPSEYLHALGWPDLGLAPALLQPDSNLVQKVAAMVAALAVSKRAPVQWTYLVHATRLSGASIEIDGSFAEQSSKQEALTAYTSQLALSSGRLRRMAANREHFVPVVGDAGTGTRIPWRPPSSLGPWLRLSIVDAQGAESWPWSHAPLRRDAAGAMHLLGSNHAALPLRFARLALPVPSPWIFDHWGWCEVK